MASPSAAQAVVVVVVACALAGLQLGGMGRDLKTADPQRQAGGSFMLVGGILLFGAMVAFFAFGLHETG